MRHVLTRQQLYDMIWERAVSKVAVGADRAASAGRGRRSGPQRGGRPPVRRRRAVGAAIGRALARSAGALRQVEEPAQTLLTLGQGRRVGEDVRGADRRPEERLPDARYDAGQSPPAGCDRKRGARDQALGRSRGGLATKIDMLADGLRRPLRFILTPGQIGDVTQAAASVLPRLFRGSRSSLIVPRHSA
jgi:hypothetical protein